MIEAKRISARATPGRVSGSRRARRRAGNACAFCRGCCSAPGCCRLSAIRRSFLAGLVGTILKWTAILSLAERFLGARADVVSAQRIFPTLPAERPASHGVNLIMRIMQIHVAIIIVTSGLHKLQMSEWWTGIALWFPLNPTF